MIRLPTFSKDGNTITAKEIKQGDRGVIHAKKNGDKLEATSVRVGSAKATEKMNMLGKGLHTINGGALLK